MQQEKLLEERNKLIEQHESKEKELKAFIESKQDEIKKLEEKIQDMERSLTENKAVIETNEHGKFTFIDVAI